MYLKCLFILRFCIHLSYSISFTDFSLLIYNDNTFIQIAHTIYKFVKAIINSLFEILKKYDVNIENEKDFIIMEFKANDYNPNETLRFIRQSTGKTQDAFSKEIKKSKGWVKNNEQGISRYYFEDLLKIAQMYDIDIIIKKKYDN